MDRIRYFAADKFVSYYEKPAAKDLNVFWSGTKSARIKIGFFLYFHKNGIRVLLLYVVPVKHRPHKKHLFGMKALNTLFRIDTFCGTFPWFLHQRDVPLVL